MKQVESRTRIHEFYECTVDDLMDKRTRDIPVVEKTADIDHVFSILSGKHHVWVVESKQTMKVIGVITEHDALALLSPAYVQTHSFSRPNLRSLQYGLAATAEDIMSKHPITIVPTEKVTEVLAKMEQHKVRRLPVVDEKNTLLGELTLHHLIYQYHKDYCKTEISDKE